MADDPARFAAADDRAGDEERLAGAAEDGRERSSVVLVEDLAISYHRPDGSEVPAVGGVGFSVREGEFVTLIGPSGCGKTALPGVQESVVVRQ
ncbi:MAG: hypothetical protein ACRDN9_12865 [Streptosporangiaceae bacterium]